MKTIKSLTGEDLPALEIEAIQAQLSFLLGKVLTIAEAAIQDKEQRKALKDLIRAAFNDKANYMHQLAYGGNLVASSTPAPALVSAE